MGRPKLNESDRRVVQINIRLTIAENEKVTRQASNSGLSAANWIRKKIFTGKFPPQKLSALDNAVYLELKKIGVNLNQVTHRINKGETPKEYQTLLQCLTKILNKIIDRLIHNEDV